MKEDTTYKLKAHPLGRIRKWKLRFFRFFLAGCFLILPVIAYFDWKDGHLYPFIIETLFALLAFIVFFFVKKELYHRVAIRVMLGLLVSLFALSAHNPTTHLFLPLFPMLAFALTSLEEGLLWVILLVAVFCLLWGRRLFIFDVELLTSMFVFVLATFIAMFYEKIRELSERSLEDLAGTDSLTGIMNRRKFYEVLRREITRARRYGSSFSIILFDLDHFKVLNDNYGHSEGDRVLKELAELIRKRLREADAFARVGGEEFIVLAPDTGFDGAVELAERLRGAIENHYFGSKLKLTASFGVTSFTKGDDEDSLLKRVDNLMYIAKMKGRNRVEASEL